jgi:hypothetical protein
MAMSLSSRANHVQHIQTVLFKFDVKNNFTICKRLMDLSKKTSGYGDIILEKGFDEPKNLNETKVDKHK